MEPHECRPPTIGIRFNKRSKAPPCPSDQATGCRTDRCHYGRPLPDRMTYRKEVGGAQACAGMAEKQKRASRFR